MNHFLFILFIAFSLLACKSENKKRDLSPVEKMLLEDSLHNAANQSIEKENHIKFDYQELNREEWQKPKEVLSKIEDIQNKIVVEIGSGTGFFTRPLAKAAKKVIALDIAPNILLLLDSINHAELSYPIYSKIEPRLVPTNNPQLQENEADAVLVVNTFMYIQNPVEYLNLLNKGLRSNSQLLIVDFKKENTPLGPPLNARKPIKDVVSHLVEAKYEDIQIDTTLLSFQYLISARTSDKNSGKN